MADIPAGSIFFLTGGIYSDYNILGHFVALEAITSEVQQEIARLINEKADIIEEAKGWYDGDRKSEFMAALIKSGFVVSLSALEIHIGEYRDLEIDIGDYGDVEIDE